MSTPEGTDFIDYYAVLGVGPTAEISEIRRAYILQAKRHHPDAGGSTEMMKALNKAYRTLSNSTAKATYDMLHSFHTGSTKPGDYRYAEGREVKAVDDMTDEEIDSFLDTLLVEYSQEQPKSEQGVKKWFKKTFKKT